MLALAFFAYDDLPRVLAQLDLEYFEEAAELLLQHPKVSPGAWRRAPVSQDVLGTSPSW